MRWLLVELLACVIPLWAADPCSWSTVRIGNPNAGGSKPSAFPAKKGIRLDRTFESSHQHELYRGLVLSFTLSPEPKDYRPYYYRSAVGQVNDTENRPLRETIAVGGYRLSRTRESGGTIVIDSEFGTELVEAVNAERREGCLLFAFFRSRDASLQRAADLHRQLLKLAAVDNARTYLRSDSSFVGLPAFPPGSLSLARPYLAPSWEVWIAAPAFSCEGPLDNVKCSDLRKAPPR